PVYERPIIPCTQTFVLAVGMRWPHQEMKAGSWIRVPGLAGGNELQFQLRRNQGAPYVEWPARSVCSGGAGADQLRPAHHHHERAVVYQPDFSGQPKCWDYRLLSL